jgi:leader peptidase (prepilin peptidase)/N-methyltransferase
MFALYFGLCFAYPAGMGFGDVKLSGGARPLPRLARVGRLGHRPVPGLPARGLFGVALMLRGRAVARRRCRSGPFMLLGVLVAILAGEQLVEAYVSATGSEPCAPTV